MPSEEDRTSATGDVHKKLGENRRERPCSLRVVLVDKHTDRQTDMLTTILRRPPGAEVQGGPKKTGLFSRVDNFVTVMRERRVICQKFRNFV